MQPDRWAEVERELLEQSTRRIHEFERRLALEWDALRQLHEEPLTALPRRERWIRATLIAVAIACAGSIAVTTFLYWRLAGQIQASERAAREAQEQVHGDAAALLRDMRQLSGQTQTALSATERMLNVLAAADMETFALAGAGATRAAAGQALWSRSRGLVLEAVRVPHPPTGEAQQAWLVTTHGPISLGFVMPDARGRVSATFDTPPELPGQVTAIVVTAEPAGGSASPGTRLVLASR